MRMKYKRTKDILTPMIVVFVVCFSLSSLVVTTRISSEIYLIISFIISTLFFLVKLSYKKLTLSADKIIITLMLIALIFLNMVVNNDFNIMNFTIVILILNAYMMSEIIQIEYFNIVYVKFIYFLCVYSFITMYIIFPFMKPLSQFFRTGLNSAGTFYRDYLFAFHFEEHIVSYKRNTGIFREMGVFQHYINIALFIQLFYMKKINWKYVFVFSLATLTTFSTPGFVFLFLIVIAYITKESDFSFNKLLNIIGILLILLALINILPDFKLLISRTLGKLSSDGLSYEGRMVSIIENLAIWLKKPILGVGINKGIYHLDVGTNLLFTAHNTSTTTTFLAVYGFVFSAIITVPYIYFFNNISTKKTVILVIIVGFLISINTQRFIYDQFYYLLLFNSLSYRKQRRGELLQ